jgi:hypothetical protein
LAVRRRKQLYYDGIILLRRSRADQSQSGEHAERYAGEYNEQGLSIKQGMSAIRA